MNEQQPPIRIRLFWSGIAVLLLGAVGAILCAALGIHGFGRGMLVGATIALVALGGVLMGAAVSRKAGRATSTSDWLPSRDS